MLWNIALVCSTAVSFYSSPHIQLRVINSLTILNISEVTLSNTTKKNLTQKSYENKKWIILQDLLYKVKRNSFSGKKNGTRKFIIRSVAGKESSGREMACGLSWRTAVNEINFSKEEFYCLCREKRDIGAIIVESQKVS